MEDWRTKLKALLESNKFEGIFWDNGFDLDGSYGPDSGSGLALWLDGDTKLDIDLEVNKENAIIVQEYVRSLGHEVYHTWSMQYSVNP